ncbi:helix-turn-helix domain-containing protein [Brevundimonas sp.]|jgi:AraC-like DNA-binding protein|uniref:helix-turn-helix domain-containing protein n=1 Tax=Brevundimonas sp. TaxID=1871086 RepID=UPI0037BEDBAB
MTAHFHFVPPHPALAGLIRRHQVIRLRFASQGDEGGATPVKPYWPRPAAALAFYVRDPETLWSPLDPTPRIKPRAVVIGQPTTLTWRQGGGDFSVYQIEFEPGALYRLIGLSLEELTDGDVDAQAVFPPDFAELLHRIEDADDPTTMIQAAESYLGRLWTRRDRPVLAVDWVASRLIVRPEAGLDRLASNAGLSPRQMRRDFGGRLGVSPKLFARIARFDALIRLRNQRPEQDWLEAALGAGYYDDHHLRRDFRLFAGVSPTRFQQMEAESPERRFGYRET